MQDNKTFRKQALAKLEGNWGTAVLFTVAFSVFCMIVGNGPSWATGSLSEGLSATLSICSLITLPASFAYTVEFLRLHRGSEMKIVSLIEFYRQKRVWAAMLLKGILAIIGSICFVIPGIVICYMFSMTEYVMLDNPQLGSQQAMALSRKMMKGKKMKLFLLDLSFIGWIILSMLTLGLGFILLCPYMQASHAAFYEDLLAEQAKTADNAGDAYNI